MKLMFSTTLLAILCLLLADSTAAAAAAATGVKAMHKRFADINQVLPSVVDKCIMACAMCTKPTAKISEVSPSLLPFIAVE